MIQVSYPGVYIEEIPSGVRTITGVATSITAFVGRARRGETSKATTINSFGDFERIYGGLDDLDFGLNYLAHAVRAFFEANTNRFLVPQRDRRWPHA